MTIPKRLQLKLFVLLCSSCSFAPRPPLTAMSQADAMRVSEPRKQYELVQPCVLTCAPCGLEAPRFAAVSGKDTGIVQAYPLRSETARNGLVARWLAEGTRYWCSEQRRMAM